MLTCGSHRVEYVIGDAMPAAFVELEAILADVTGEGRTARRM